MSRQSAPISLQLRAQVVSLRRAGMDVNSICHRLGMEKSTERQAVSMICDTLPRKYGMGGLTTPGPAHKWRGGV